MLRILVFVVFPFVLFFSGCKLIPPYQSPTVPMPSEWKHQQTQINTPPQVKEWWEIFEDEKLNELEQLAIDRNYNLEIAEERVTQARDFAKIVRSQLYPQINLLPAYNNQDILTKLFGRGAAAQAMQNAQISSSEQKTLSSMKAQNLIREHQLLYSLPLSLSYEVDLWGRIRGEYQSALFQAGARNEDFQTILLMLTTDLAIAYFQLRTQDTLIQLFNRTIETRKKALAINQAQYDAKIIDYSPVALAALDLNNVERQYYESLRQRAVLEDQIAVLIGISPSIFQIDHLTITKAPPEIPASLPSEILLQRPDLLAQEFTMASIYEQIGVAYASIFPTVQLTGGIGFSSPISKEFGAWKSRYWGFGTNISQYIFDAGARYYNVQLTWAEFREAVDTYQQRVLIAFQEVEDALSNLDLLAKEMNSAQGSVDSAHKAYTISYDRYLMGVSFYLEVADNERQELDNQRIYFDLLGLRYINTIQLIKALGGTWKGHEETMTRGETCGS